MAQGVGWVRDNSEYWVEGKERKSAVNSGKNRAKENRSGTVQEETIHEMLCF